MCTTDGDNNFYFGASAYHVTRPKETFHGGNFLLEPDYITIRR